MIYRQSKYKTLISSQTYKEITSCKTAIHIPAKTIHMLTKQYADLNEKKITQQMNWIKENMIF